ADGAATSASAKLRRYCARLMNGPGGGCAPSLGSNGSGGVLASLSCDAAASAGIWRPQPLEAHAAPGGSATAPPSPLLCQSASSGHPGCRASPTSALHNPANRRIRTRMSGGVGGEESQGSPLSRFSTASLRGVRSTPKQSPFACG